MSEYNRTNYYAEEAGGLKTYIAGIFVRMGIAMAITAAVAFAGYISLMNGGIVYSLLMSRFGYLALALVQLGVCVALSASIMTMSTAAVSALFYVYAALTGVTFSVLPAAFGMATVFQAFLFASVMFFSCAIIGHTTNVDLSKFSGLMIGGLFAMILASVLSMFIPALQGSLIISYIGVVLFLALTAWDMQKIKSFYYGTGNGYGTAGANMAVYGAFQLYLDFINLFLYILRIFGSRNNRN